MDQTPFIPQSPPTPTPTATSSLAGRLLNVFATPGEAFDQVKAASPSAVNWLIPAVLFIAISWLGALLVFSQESIGQQLNQMANKTIDRQVEKGNLTSTQADQAREMAEKWGSLSYKIVAVVLPVLLAFTLPFWWGLILWLGGTKVFKGNFPYIKAVEVAGLTNMVLVLDALVRTLLVLVTGNLFATPSLALTVKEFDPQNTVHSLLSLVNVMVFWVLLVRSIGLSRLSGASLGKAAAWVFGIWMAYTSLLIGISAGARAVFGG